MFALWAVRVVLAARGQDPSGPQVTGAFILAILVLTAVTRGRGLIDFARALLICVGALSLAGANQRLGSDGIEHYAMARSILFDHDLRLENEVEALQLSVVFRTEEGRVIARGPFGQSVVWMPVIAVAHGLVTLLHLTGIAPEVAADGFSPPYHVAVTTASFLMAFAGLLLMDRLMRTVLRPGLAAIGALALFYATPLHFYAVSNPSLSHACQVFLMAVLVTLWRAARAGEAIAPWRWCGVAGGLVGLLRTQDFFLLVPVGLDALARRGGVRALLALSPGVLAGGLVQLAVWRELFGADFFRVMLEFNHYAPGESQIVELLLSPRHGMISWTPLYLVAFAGLILALRREFRFVAFAWVIVALSVVANSRFVDWWASDSFGQRRMLGLLPLLALGFGYGLEALRRRPAIPIAVLLGALAWWNSNLEYIYNSEMVAPKTEAIGFDASARAQLEVTRRELIGRDGRWPETLFRLAWDNFAGGFLDDPGRRFEVEDEGFLLARLGGPWSGPRSDGPIVYRTALGRRSEIAAVLRGPGAMEITLNLRAARPEAPPARLEVTFEGHPIGSVEVTPSWRRVAITAPPQVVRRGFNAFGLRVPPGESVDVDWVRVERRP